MQQHAPILLFALLAVAACNGEVYVRDGVTDGDTFYLSPQAITDADPVLQSWVSYSLTKSACQLALGSDNPARANSFDCEQVSRRHLLETWAEKKHRDSGVSDTYLDQLLDVERAAYLDEYVAHYFALPDWTLPNDLDMADFHAWRRMVLKDHRPETRIIGSWNYRRNVSAY